MSSISKSLDSFNMHRLVLRARRMPLVFLDHVHMHQFWNVEARKVIFECQRLVKKSRTL